MSEFLEENFRRRGGGFPFRYSLALSILEVNIPLEKAKYCESRMTTILDGYHVYFSSSSFILRYFIHPILHYTSTLRLKNFKEKRLMAKLL